jgi:hypothetical protein
MVYQIYLLFKFTVSKYCIFIIKKKEASLPLAYMTLADFGYPV